MLEVRICFDALMHQYPTLDSHLAVDSDIVKNEDFETGIVTLQKGNFAVLTDEVKNTLAKFITNETANEQVETTTESRVLQALRINRATTDGNYVDTRGVCPTSNHLERLFSQCKLIRSSLRQG
jgi:hypothetical protein